MTESKILKKLLPWIRAKNADYKEKKVPATLDRFIKDLEKLA